jgi:hypothetical protein
MSAFNATQLPIRLSLILQREDWDVHILESDDTLVTIQVDWVFPLAILSPLLDIAHQLDRNTINQQCPKV